jgi:hypothetical protein
LESAVDVAMQEGLSQTGGESVAFHVSSFLPIYRAKGENAVFSMTQDCQPLPFRLPLDTATNRLLSLKWTKLLTGQDVSLFKACDSVLRIYGGEPDTNPVLCDVLAILPVCQPNQLFMVRLMSLLFSSESYVAAFADRLLQVIFVRFAQFRLSLLSNLLSKIWRSVSVSSEHLYTLLYTVRSLLEIASALDVDFQGKVDVDMHLLLITALCSESPPVRDLALQTAAQFRAISKSYTLDQLIDDAAPTIEEHAKRIALMSVSPDRDFSAFPNLKFRDVAKSGLNELYQFFLASLGTACSQHAGKINLPTLTVKMLGTFKGLLTERCPPFLAGNIVSFILNSSSPQTVQTDPLVSFAKAAFTNLKLTNALPFFTSLHPAFREPCFGMKFTSEAFLRTVCFGVRVLARDDLSLQFMFSTLDSIIPLIQDQSIGSDIVQNARLAAMVLFEVLEKRLTQHKTSPFLRRKALLADLNTFFDPATWYAFVMKFHCTVFGQLALAALLKVAHPAPSVFESENLKTYSARVLAGLLSSSPEEYLPEFIKEASDVSNIGRLFFTAIVAQFSFGDPQSVIAQLVSNLNAAPGSVQSEFELTISNATGSLIALAFAYIVDDSEILKIEAYEMLIVAAIGSSLTLSRPDAAARIFNKMIQSRFTLRSQLANLYMSSLVSISALLATDLAFCTEQFIHQMLVMIKASGGANSKLAPWLHGAVFDLGTTAPCVFPQTDARFALYSFYMLVRDLCDLRMTADIFVIIDNLLNMKNQAAIIDELIHVLYGLFLETPTNVNITGFLSYVLEHHPIQTSAALFQFLRQPMWYFYYSGAFDADYSHAVEFAVRVLGEAVRHAPARFSDHFAVGYGLSLVTLQPGTSNELLVSLLPVLGMEGSPNEVLIFREFQKRGHVFQEKLGIECLMWGLCCGHMVFAARALALYRRFLEPVNADVVVRLQNNTRLASAIAHEKLTDGIVDYIGNLWETLLVICQKLKVPREDV